MTGSGVSAPYFFFLPLEQKVLNDMMSEWYLFFPTPYHHSKYALLCLTNRMASSLPKLSRPQSGTVELHPRQPIGYLRMVFKG